MPQPADKSGIKYAGFGIRVAATFIDILCTIVLIPIFTLFDKLSGTDKVRIHLQKLLEQSQQNPGSVTLNDLNAVFVGLAPSMIFQLIVVAALFIWAWSRLSSTPGKMLFRLKIVDAITHQTPSLGQSTLRFAGSIISLLFFGIGFIWIHYDKKRQGWHDKISGTVVIHTKSLRSNPH